MQQKGFNTLLNILSSSLFIHFMHLVPFNSHIYHILNSKDCIAEFYM